VHAPADVSTTPHADVSLNRRRSRVSLETCPGTTGRTGRAARYSRTPPSAPSPVLKSAHHTLPNVASVVADAARTVPANAEASRRRRDNRRSWYRGCRAGGGGVARPTAVGGLRRGGSSAPNGSGFEAMRLPYLGPVRLLNSGGDVRELQENLAEPSGADLSPFTSDGRRIRGGYAFSR
jgi:hypothetical protein